MIGKIIKGKSFKGCISYVLDKEYSKLLDSEGVLLGDTKSIINSFYMQSLMNPKLAKSIGHIPLAYAVEDAPKMTDEFMVQLAKEYMQEMKIANTQYIIVRHSDKSHPHCHIVFNRVDNDGKTISDKNDRYRNTKVCKMLKERYGLHFGEGKEKVNLDSLKDPDKTKYEIYHAVNSALKLAKDWRQFASILSKHGITIVNKYKGKTDEVQGISFKKGDYSFKGSDIDRNFSYSKLNNRLTANQEQAKNVAKEITKQDFSNERTAVTHKTASSGSFISGGFSLFDINPNSTNPEEEQFINEMQRRKRKKNKRRGRSL
ncbi:MAG: relaxase/mobilization nuclease domain-containing protein [Tannerella sp.]|jgi:hypothetical protein|nr:relaxase/mobilization nuclease domain-containing protein [Tannerella sp.]